MHNRLHLSLRRHYVKNSVNNLSNLLIIIIDTHTSICTSILTDWYNNYCYFLRGRFFKGVSSIVSSGLSSAVQFPRSGRSATEP